MGGLWADYYIYGRVFMDDHDVIGSLSSVQATLPAFFSIMMHKCGFMLLDVVHVLCVCGTVRGHVILCGL